MKHELHCNFNFLRSVDFLLMLYLVQPLLWPKLSCDSQSVSTELGRTFYYEAFTEHGILIFSHPGNQKKLLIKTMARKRLRKLDILNK